MLNLCFTDNHWGKKIYPETLWRNAPAGTAWWFCFGFLPQAALSPLGPGRRPFLWYVTWLSSLQTYGIWLTIPRKTQQPDNSWQVGLLHGTALSCYCFLQKVTSIESSAHLATIPGFSTHTLTTNGSNMDPLNRPDVTGASHLVYYSSDDIVYIRADDYLVPTGLTN